MGVGGGAGGDNAPGAPLDPPMDCMALLLAHAHKCTHIQLLSTEWVDYVEEPMKYQALRPQFFSVGGWGVVGVAGVGVGGGGAGGVIRLSFQSNSNSQKLSLWCKKNHYPSRWICMTHIWFPTEFPRGIIIFQGVLTKLNFLMKFPHLEKNC